MCVCEGTDRNNVATQGTQGRGSRGLARGSSAALAGTLPLAGRAKGPHSAQRQATGRGEGEGEGEGKARERGGDENQQKFCNVLLKKMQNNEF